MEYKQYKNNANETLTMWYDDNAENPLREMETLFTYYTWGRFESMQENDFSSPAEFYDSIMGNGAFTRQKARSLSENKGSVGFVNSLCENLKQAKIIAFPILFHNHSTIRFYLGNSIDRWDGGIAGFAFIEKEKVYNEFNVKRITGNMMNMLQSEVMSNLNMYTDFANGNVYGFSFSNANNEIVDSCGGFAGYDSDEEMLTEMLSYVNVSDNNFVAVA